MSELDRAAAACLFASFGGTSVPDWVARWLERGLGGVTLFGSNVADGSTAALAAELRGRSPELLVSIDEEGGDVTRLEAARGSSYPGNLALGVVDDPALTRDVARALGAELARNGVNLDLAPVADVNSNPGNPVIAVRSFGADPALVARHTAAFVEGLQRQGVAACAKHFPGHGDTDVDSHRDLPVVAGELEAALPPFRAAIAAGVRAVMTGHLVVEALDAVPATVSRRILTGLLREELGFGGLVVTDALDMRALSATLGPEESAVLAVAAGADAVCLGPSLGEHAVASVHAALVTAAASGRLPPERLGEAAARVAETARWAASPTPEGAPGPEVGAEAARRALRVRGEARVAAAPLVVELVPEANVAAGESEHGLAALWPGAAGERVEAPGGDAAALLAGHDGRPLVLVTRDAARHAWQRVLVEALLARRPDAVVVETGLPDPRATGAATTVETHGAGRANLLAAVEALALRP